MEQLEKLKDIWKNQGESAIRFSDKDINKMLQKKSSSIVKWILIISILEFVLPNIIYLVTDHDASRRIYEDYGLTNITMIYTAVHVVIICVFIYFFYKNYKNITADSSVKELLHNILKTRKTVKYYIYYNLTMAAIIGVHIFYIVFNSESFLEKLPENLSLVTVWLVALLLLSISIFIFWIFYRILYGILLKKLNNNYNELLRNE
jgi:magnesium-transporting ATPase (P-type)